MRKESVKRIKDKFELLDLKLCSEIIFKVAVINLWKNSILPFAFSCNINLNNTMKVVYSVKSSIQVSIDMETKLEANEL